MNIMKEIKYFSCLLKISKWLYFIKKAIAFATIAIAICSAITCCCGCKNMMSCCEK